MFPASGRYQGLMAAPDTGQEALGTERVSQDSIGVTPVGCRGGNRYVEGDLLTFGYLMLYDALGYPY